MRFRVLMHARNVLIDTNGRPQRLGFFTTRVVEAANRNDAEGRAIELLRSDDWLNKSMLNVATDPFTVVAEEVDEASPDEAAMIGYSWYPMKGQPDS